MQAALVSFLPAPFSVHVSLKGKSLPLQEQFLSLKNRPFLTYLFVSGEAN